MKFEIDTERSEKLYQLLGDIKYCSTYEVEYTGNWVEETEADTGYTTKVPEKIIHWCFTLYDLLKLLPKYFEAHGQGYYFDIQYIKHSKIKAGYKSFDNKHIMYEVSTDEFIDALYEIIMKIIESDCKYIIAL